MLGAQSVPRSTDTSAETTAPLADTSIHDQLVKACPLVDQTRFKFVDVSYSGWVNFLLQYTPQVLYSTGFRSGEFGRHSVGERSLALFAPLKRRCRVLDAPVHRPFERQNPTLGYPE